MKLKERMQKAVLALSDNRLLGRKKLAISYVSLFLVFTLVLVTTMAWFTVKDTENINSQTFSLESSAALRVNDGEEDLSNHIVVKDFKLEEASSVDGRNMFFPSEGNFSDSTSAMKFREGTAGDRNKTYVYKDFKLNADSGMTNVYIKGYNITVVSADGKTVLGKFDGSTEIKYDGETPVDQVVYDKCPLRLAFITDSSKTPVVIDPSALIDAYARNYNAVSSVNSSGAATTQQSSCKTFSDFYFYSGESLFTLMGQDPLDVTLVAWFEGAYEDQSVYDKYAGASVTIDVELESNYDDMEAITFVDDTVGDDGTTGPWIIDEKNPNSCIVTMQYTDTDKTKKTVVMRHIKTDSGLNAWTAALPKNVTTDISFFRFSTENNVIYNSWHTRAGINEGLNDIVKDWIGNYPLQESRIVNGTRSLTYTAKRGNSYRKVEETDPDKTKKRLSPCVGYWDYNSSGSTVETTAPSPTTPTSGGGSSEDPEINTGVYLNIPDTKQWLRNYLTSGTYEPYVIYNYNGKKSEHLMQFEPDGARCTLDNCSAPRGSRVIGFKFVNKNGTHTQLIPAKNEYIFSKSFNVSYDVNNDNTATYH